MDVVELMTNVTRKWEEQIGLRPSKGEPAKPASTLDEKQRMVVDMVSGSFGCYNSEVADLMSVVMDIPKEAFCDDGEDEDEYDLPMGAVVRLKGNPNAHNYPLDTPILIGRNSTGFYRLQHNGTTTSGNRLPGESWAYETVTDEEIAGFEHTFIELFMSGEL